MMGTSEQPLPVAATGPPGSSATARPRGGGSTGGGRSRSLSPITLAQWAAAGLIAVGWWLRDERWMVPDRGAGYALGIAGLAAMVLLLGYPLRKRMRALRHAGRVAGWFQIHMLLGLVGPVAILYHSNFGLGSTNANVALACVLVVAGSGVVGRVLYVRIHVGLEGRRRTLEELRAAVAESQQRLATVAASEAVVKRLADYERRVLGAESSAFRRVLRRLTLGASGRTALRDVRRLLRRSADRSPEHARAQRAVQTAAGRYVRGVRSVAGFRTWERLFAFWHVAHLPLSFLLFTTAAVHVIAVHLY